MESILTRKTATSILFYSYLPVPLCNPGFPQKQTGSGRAGGEHCILSGCFRLTPGFGGLPSDVSGYSVPPPSMLLTQHNFYTLLTLPTLINFCSLLPLATLTNFCSMLPRAALTNFCSMLPWAALVNFCSMLALPALIDFCSLRTWTTTPSPGSYRRTVTQGGP